MVLNMTPVSRTDVSCNWEIGKHDPRTRFDGRAQRRRDVLMTSCVVDQTQIAAGFVQARLRARPLDAFPGPIPATLDAAYRCQDLAIALWPDRIAGWKVGRINPPDDTVFQTERLAGPIFSRTIQNVALGAPRRVPVITGGFAAVEAEFIFAIGQDAPPEKFEWTLAEATDLVAEVHIGIEMAGSPLSTINDLGPLVIASDFGNNAGLLVGPAASGWRRRPTTEWLCETIIDGVSVGRGAVDELPGGPFEAIRFIAQHAARRGRPLTAGDLISTGAVTGVHDIRVGQTAVVRFQGLGDLVCQATRAEPSD